MAADPFLEENFRVLTPEAFEFVLSNELKRAVRSQNFVTLVLLQPRLEAVAGHSGGDRDQATREVARLITRDMRETDLVSHTAQGQLSVVLLDADMENALRVINRLMARLDHYEFATPLSFEIGAACCPTHGADVDTLRRVAASRKVRERGDRSNVQ